MEVGKKEMIVAVDRFYMAQFSALEQAHCVACDSK